MGKRGATQAAGAKAKARKAAAPKEAKAVEEAKAEVEEQQQPEECAPIMELLSLADDLPMTCRGMLGAMAPYSLRSTQGERHQYQEQMIGVLSQVFTSIEDNRKEAVASIEAQIAEAETERTSTDAALTAAVDKEVAETAARDAKAAANTEAEEAAQAAEEALKAAQARVESFESEQKAVEAEKEEYEQLAGPKLEQLKAGTFPGNQWRQRDKMIAEVTKALELLDPEEASLRGALGAALKAKPGQRGRFAEKSIEFTEGLLAKRIEQLREQLANGEVEKTQRVEAVAAAEQALGAAKESRDNAQNEYIAADNTLMEASEAKRVAKETLAAFEPQLTQLTADLAAARERLETVQALGAKFEALRSPPAPEEPACVKEVAAEAMAVEEPEAVAAA